MSDNNDGFVPSIQAKSDATQQKQDAVKADSASAASPQKDSGGTSDGFVPSVRAKSTPEGTEPKEPGLLDTANQYYEGRPAIPMAPTTEYAGNLLHRIGSSLGRTAMILPNMSASAVHAVVDEPTLDDAGPTVQDRIAKRLLIDPSLRAIEQEKQHEEKDAAAGMPHKTPEKVLNRAVSAVPLIGPFVEGEGQRAGQGDVAGALTDVGGMVALGELGNKAAPKIVSRVAGTVGKVADVASKIKSPDTSTLGGVLTDEAKQYALRKIPGYDVVKTAKRIANKISDLKEAENASALPDEQIPSRAEKPALTDPNLVDNSYIPSRSAKPAAGLKPILPEEPTTEAAPEELKPIGSKVAEPASELKPVGQAAPEESAEVRQARHVLGNVAVDKLQTAEGGPEALRRLTKGSYQQYADLANALDIKKPAYLAEKNGDAWQASEFKRTVKEHGKSLSGPKETVVRELLSKPPAEILQHTNPWVDSTAKYPAQMSSLTERTMKALGLTEEAKNNLRASGVSDAQAQSLLAKLTKRQLENLAHTPQPTAEVHR